MVHATYSNNEQVGVVVAFYTYIWEVPTSNLGHNTG